MKKIVRVSLLIFLIAWMLLIFSLSAETATESADKSGGFSYKIASIFVPDFKDMSEAEQLEILGKMSFPIRKGAHFSIFAVLSCLAFLNVSFFEKWAVKIKYLSAFCFTALYAASDEFHQRFVEGRSCELRDWLIDSAGAIVGLLLCFVVAKIKWKRECQKCGKKSL